MKRWEWVITGFFPYPRRVERLRCEEESCDRETGFGGYCFPHTLKRAEEAESRMRSQLGEELARKAKIQAEQAINRSVDDAWERNR